MKVPKKLAGRVILLLGEFYQYIDELKAAVKAEGGVLAGKLDKRVDLIVDLPKKTKARTQVMNQAKAMIRAGATIEILAYRAFHDRIQPTPDEAARMIRGGGAGRRRLEEFVRWWPFDKSGLCIKGESFVGLKWAGSDRRHIDFEDCDFSRADLSRGHLERFTRCKLDGAKLDENSFGGQFQSCSMRGVSGRGARFGAWHSDLSGANLEKSEGVSLQECVARKAHLNRADITYARFAGTDFQGASFQGAVLQGGDLSKTNLGGANLAGANLEGASLEGADLSGANLRGARLSNARLKGATVAQADFTGAVTTGADLRGVNLAVAIGLGPAKAIKGGPKLAALVAAVKGARDVKINLDIGFKRGSPVEVDLRAAGPSSSWLQIDRVRRDGLREGTMEFPSSLTDAMLQVANRFGDGKLRIDSITVKSKKSPVSGRPLTDMVVAAWCELFGVPDPTPPRAAVAPAARRAPRPRPLKAPAPQKKPAPPAVARKPRPAGAPIDVATFMQRLARGTDPDRLAKAVKMLKADRFRLFSDVSEGRVVGVVKSQTDAELVYACALDDAGSFSCCTQNLNVCGGLRGALCKHLLVLVVGLTQAGTLDPTAVDGWVMSSKRGRPVLDRDAMSEIFLRGKGAETGQIDWRPVETIPEDYYAL